MNEISNDRAYANSTMTTDESGFTENGSRIASANPDNFWNQRQMIGLSGCYFHGINPNNPNNHWSGQIINCEQGEYYNVLTRYGNGKPECRHSVHISDMKTWEFYETEEDLAKGLDYYKQITQAQQPVPGIAATAFSGR